MDIIGGAAFHVLLDGRSERIGDFWFLPGTLQASWFASCEGTLPPTSEKVLVKLSEAMFQAVARQSRTLRILQAEVIQGLQGPIIDTTSGRAVVAGAAPTRQDTVLEISEVFCGGFNGWSQGVQVLRSFGYDCCVKWLLDTDETCYEGTRQLHPAVHKAYTQADLEQASQGDAPVFVCASLEHVWWAQGPALTSPQILCASPPCQPWSQGGTGSGLESQDGQLVLHLLGQLAFLQVPIVLIEQVPAFRSHPHFPAVREAWIEAGYQERWFGTMDLVECAPVSRNRFLLLLVRDDVPSPNLVFEKPVLPPRPTLGSFDCLPDQQPLGMLEACRLSPEVLQMYMDPWFMPPSRHPQGRQQTPRGLRLRGLGDRAPTFLAQYHFQHELSPRVLERLVRGPV